MSFQQCRFNFGSEPFKYPPNRPFKNFNENAVLNAQDKVRFLNKLFIISCFLMHSIYNHHFRLSYQGIYISKS